MLKKDDITLMFSYYTMLYVQRQIQLVTFSNNPKRDIYPDYIKDSSKVMTYVGLISLWYVVAKANDALQKE